MSTEDNLYVGENARERIARGIRKVADAVGSTMGTGGHNGLIEAIEYPHYLLTNDGFSIASSVKLADPIENMGRAMLLEAISRANKQSGDGSSTTCVLTSAIIEEGTKFLQETSPIELKRSLEACVPLIEKSINKQRSSLLNEPDQIIDLKRLEQVASISAEDEEVGKTIAEIYYKIGPEGIIHWDISKTAEDSYTIGSGITVEGAKYYSPYMCDADESGNSTGQIRIQSPKVLLTKQKISSASEFNDLFQALYNKEIRDIVVFCDEIEPLVVPDLIKTRAMRGFRTVLVKMPTIYKDVWYEDLALASGAKIVDAIGGFPMKNAKIEDLGMFGNITITKDDTYIDGINDLSGHVKILEEEGSDDSVLRVARLNTKTARYFVGAQSDAALSYKRLKVEDAISAAYQAIHGGIVTGGGFALLESTDVLPNDVGGRILGKALRAPKEQIEKNMGRKLTRKDLETEQVYDPAPVVLNAVKNAISVAAAALTANTVITFPRVDNLGEAFSRQIGSMMPPQ